MILTAHQPVYLPWLGLFHKIALAETFVYFDQVQYLPKDWMNRNKIRTKDGSIWLTVPVLRKGYRDLKSSEIEINNSINWQKKHLRSISLNYKKSPYFVKCIMASIKGAHLKHIRYDSTTPHRIEKYLVREAWTKTQWKEWVDSKLDITLYNARKYVPFYQTIQ